MSAVTGKIQFQSKLDFLFQPMRYKVAYGGRGSGKSWGFARALIALAVERPLRILCAREIQNSLKESVYKLLCDQIESMGLRDRFAIGKEVITSAAGSEIFFAGIRNNTDKIRSYEGVDICWVEEAHNVTEASWSILTPTIRKDGSEIWVTFNPRFKTDPTYMMFVSDPLYPDMTIARKVNYVDNPWFPEILRLEMEALKAKDFDSYLNIWEGHCINVLAGAIYEQELRLARMEGRIMDVPYDPLFPVDTFWDLGWLDSTCIWMGQKVGLHYHIIDYVSGSRRDINSYLRELEAKNYVFGTFWLPHDAKAKNLQTGRSIEELIRKAGRSVQIVPKLSIADGINAARTIFPLCYFDARACEEGLEALANYQNGPDGKPKHDFASHGADGYRYLALSLNTPKTHNKRSRAKNMVSGSSRLGQTLGRNFGWMK